MFWNDLDWDLIKMEVELSIGNFKVKIIIEW